MPSAKQEFESPSPHQQTEVKPASIADLVIYKNNSVTSVSKVFNYRPPSIVKAKHGWYIKFYYRIPPELRHLHNNKIWQLYRIKEDINRRKGFEKEQYAEYLRNEVNEMLRSGFNPFTKTIEKFTTQEKPELNATDAMLLFLETWSKRGLENTSFSKYKKVVGRFMDWLKLKRIPYINITEINQDHIEKFLNDMKKEHGFSNREFNNHFDFLRTAFNFLVNKKHIPESPCNGIEKLKSKSTKHRYYDEKSLKAITKALELRDPYTLFAFYTIYYLAVRSDKELMNLRVGNIKWEESKILIDVSKGNSEEYIPMDENIKALFKERNIDKYPDGYYIFGISGTPSVKPFGKGFFSKRFAKVRDAAGLSKDFSLYSAKYTRIVHLKYDGVSDSDIMSLTRHKTFEAYSIYLRGLGLTADIKNINAKSRKI